jgi:pyruvate formate lyase activating enzyme
MNIRGLHKFSLVDYPGKMACIVFVGECNCRCPYCHNPCLVFDPESQPHIEDTQVFAFLEKRKGKLDGVVISGGEPSLRSGLAKFAKKIKEMGFLVKLDTNGSNPRTVIKCIEDGIIDALGVDYKAPSSLYNKIAGTHINDFAGKVHEVISYAVKKNMFIDVRTTVHKSLLSLDDLREMRKTLDGIGLKKWFLQQFHPVEIIDDELLAQPTYSDEELLSFAKSLDNTYVRGLKGIIVS